MENNINTLVKAYEASAVSSALKQAVADLHNSPGAVQAGGQKCISPAEVGGLRVGTGKEKDTAVGMRDRMPAPHCLPINAPGLPAGEKFEVADISPNRLYQTAVLTWRTFLNK